MKNRHKVRSKNPITGTVYNKKLVRVKSKPRKLGGRLKLKNPLRIDPTRTITLRKQFESKIRQQFKALKFAVRQLVLTEDAFGLKQEEPTFQNIFNAFCPTGPGGGVDPTCSPSPGESSKHDSVIGETKELKVGGEEEKGGEGSTVEGGGKSAEVSKGIEKGNIREALKALGGKAHHIEESIKHYLSDKINHAVSKLPDKLQAAVKATFYLGKMGTKAAFATWKAGQALAERVSRERGASEEEARRLRGVLSGVDIASFKPLSLGLGASGVGTAAIGLASLVPPATASYLAYSTARDPMATYRAAKGLIRDSASRLTSKFHHNRRYVLNSLPREEGVRTLDGLLKSHGYSDWYIALLTAAMESSPSLEEAINLTEQAFKDQPSPDLSKGNEGVESGLDLGIDLGVNTPLTANAGIWRFHTNPQKVKAFQRWIKSQLAQKIKGESAEALWKRYIEAGFKKGAGRAFDDLNKTRRWKPGEGDFYKGSKNQFLKDSFAQPVAVEKVQLLAGRSYDDLDGITSDMSLRMSRKLTDGLVEGKSPYAVAKDLEEEVDLGDARARTIARTEIIRAHAEGQLQALEDLGVEEVGVAVEWSTTMDDRVCELCEPLEGMVLKLEEARGMLPRHPNCRCSWIPANVGEDTEGQQRTRGRIQKALDESIELEGEDSSWAGQEKDIGKSRPKSILNKLIEFHYSRKKFSRGELN